MGGSSFKLAWPTDAGQVSSPFSAVSGSVSIAAPAGTAVKAAADGTVLSANGNMVEIRSSDFVVIYGNLRNLKVQAGQKLTAGTLLGESAGPDSIQLAVLQPLDPAPMLPAPVVKPVTGNTTTAPKPGPGEKFYLTPTQTGLRIRETPKDGKPVGQASPGAILEVIEPISEAKAKLGVKDTWVNVRTLNGLTGYSAGEFLAVFDGHIPTGSTLGMNLDMHNRLGHPAPERMNGIGWIRVKYNVSFNPDNNTYGNTDVDGAFRRLKPFLEPYVRAGIKVLVVFTHQLYGEGAGYNWPLMDTGRWNDLIPKYADYARRAVSLLQSANLAHCYQIWNEQDTSPSVARAAVPIPAKDYANMLTQTIRAIRSVDKTTPIITGGHVGGPSSGGIYARTTLANMPADVRPDGIASHPYGRGVATNKFSPFGALEEEIQRYAAVMPGKPVWLTEWGVLDRQGDMSIVQDVNVYATGFMNIIKNQFPGQVAAAIWYAWADGMDNGYGLVDSDDKPKRGLIEKFLTLG